MTKVKKNNICIFVFTKCTKSAKMVISSAFQNFTKIANSFLGKGLAKKSLITLVCFDTWIISNVSLFLTHRHLKRSVGRTDGRHCCCSVSHLRLSLKDHHLLILIIISAQIPLKIPANEFSVNCVLPWMSLLPCNDHNSGCHPRPGTCKPFSKSDCHCDCDCHFIVTIVIVLVIILVTYGSPALDARLFTISM